MPHRFIRISFEVKDYNEVAKASKKYNIPVITFARFCIQQMLADIAQGREIEYNYRPAQKNRHGNKNSGLSNIIKPEE